LIIEMATSQETGGNVTSARQTQDSTACVTAMAMASTSTRTQHSRRDASASGKVSVAWQFFVRKAPDQSDSNASGIAADNWKAQAVCSLCRATISLGSKVLKNQTTSSLLSHLRSKHAKEFSEAELKKNDLLTGEAGKRQTKLSDDNIWSTKWPIDSLKAVESVIFVHGQLFGRSSAEYSASARPYCSTIRLRPNSKI
jgi:hypothetical protein